MSDATTRRATRIRRLAAAAALAALGQGCSAAVGPDFEPPVANTPPAWEAPMRGGLESREDAHTLAAWWKVFGDDELDDLLARAAAASTDVRVATARLRQARAARSRATADLFPSIDASADYSRRRRSAGTPGLAANEFDFWSATFDSSWEIDLFGGLRRAREQADAEAGAAEAELRDVLVTVLAEVARTTVEMRSFAERVDIARRNADSQRATLDMTRWRFDAGLAGELEVEQAATALAQTEARVPVLETSLASSRNRLATLLGVAPGDLGVASFPPRPVPTAPRQVAVGVPADLLRRRPDVAAAEKRLAAATASVGVAKADLYPRLTLNGSIGVSAIDFADLDSSAARAYSIGPSIRWNVFDAGRIRALVAERSAAVDEALAAWDAAVLGAWEEAENALVAWEREQQRRDRLAQGLVSAREAESLARLEYENGLSDFREVLEAQRTLLTLEESLAESTASVTTGLVALYKALGGGWQSIDCRSGTCSITAAPESSGR